MSYNKKIWANGDLITKEGMNNIEDGIFDAHDKINVINNKVEENTTDTNTARQDISDIKLEIGTEELTTSSKKIKGAINDLNSQIKDIENNMQNIGKPTDEQVKNVINEAIANGDIVAGGLTSTAQTLLISILRNTLFTSDQSANITLLQSELAKGNSGSGGSETTQYVITNTLNNATTSNSIALVDANSSYTATITVNEGYALEAITVTMGGTDITSSAVSGTTITISAVTGNVVITVETTATSTGGGSTEMVTDGLVNYFDFRTVTENTLSDGQISILPTTGNGCFYSWGHINSQGEYGAKLSSNVSYSANGTNSQTNCGASFTWVFKCYMESAYSPLFSTTHAKASNTSKLNFAPKYKTSSSTATSTGTDAGGDREMGYQCFIMTVNSNECKLYYEGVLVETKDGSTLTDFTSWDDKLAMGILGGKENGYVCQVAIYNRALTDVEVVETNEYLKTLEVGNAGSDTGGGSTEMVTDGLVNYFDFRTAEYNNNGAGGSTIINATQGNGSLYTWATDRVTEQGDYGMIVTRSMIYNGTSVGTTTTSLGTSFTVIFKCYITSLGSPLFDNGYASLSNTAKLTYRPKYKTTSGTGYVDGVGLGERLDSGYETVTLMVDGNICKLYFGTILMQTNDGSTISDFQGWYDQLPGIAMLGAKGYLSQIAVYNKALSEVELVDMIDYLTTLEVK